ncbi:MAG: hypothetical protein UH788_08925 [Treponemataceae bacterium]|nr:hypothetical protein [Treponemataceae bacterium]
MKNKLHNKNAGILILISLIVLSLAEIVFRHIFLRGKVSFTANYAETLVVLILALTILIFTLKGKERLCYILYGAWIAFFVLNQVFELSGHFIYIVTTDVWSNANSIINIGLIVHVLSYVGIIVMGILLVEYMNDGSIYNRAFNITFVLTLVLLLISVCISVFNFVAGSPNDLMLLVFNNIYRIIMTILFVFFAYDSAKKQLSKVNFS